MINFTCAKCGSKEYVTRKGKNHKGLYCLICGKLDRYLTREKKGENSMNNEDYTMPEIYVKEEPTTLIEILNDFYAKYDDFCQKYNELMKEEEVKK
jgi:hypothetical protein